MRLMNITSNGSSLVGTDRIWYYPMYRRHVYGNRDRCILYEEVNVVLLLIPVEDLFYYSVLLYAYIIKLTIE